MIFIVTGKTANIFSMSLSYIWPGTWFDLKCSQFGQTKKRRENSMFQCNKIMLEVSTIIIQWRPRDLCMNVTKSSMFNREVIHEQ